MNTTNNITANPVHAGTAMTAEYTLSLFLSASTPLAHHCLAPLFTAMEEAIYHEGHTCAASSFRLVLLPVVAMIPPSIAERAVATLL